MTIGSDRDAATREDGKAMTERTHHACFSGDVTCSGCDPCPECQGHVRGCVLPVAARAAGFGGEMLADLHILIDVIRAAADRMRAHAASLDRLGLTSEARSIRKDADALAVERMPLSERTLVATEEDQVRALLAGYEAGWVRLHEAMENVPSVREKVVRTLVRPVDDGAGDVLNRQEVRGRGAEGSKGPSFDVFGDGAAVVRRDSPLTVEDVAASVESIGGERDVEAATPANGSAQA